MSANTEITKYLTPASAEEAVGMAQANRERYRFLAGGTDVMPNRYQGNDSREVFIDLSGIGAMHGITWSEQECRIGALETLTDIAEDTRLREEFPVLCEAAEAVGSPLIRNSATLGGNLLCENRCIYFNQSSWWRDAIGSCLKSNGDRCIATGSLKHCFSEMVSDTAPAIISLNGRVEIMRPDRKTEILPLESIYTGDGVNPRNLPEGALILAVLLSRGREFRSVFKKLRLRQSLDFTSLTCVVTVDNARHVRIALSGVDPKPVLVETGPPYDLEDLIHQALRQARAVDNETFSRIYRRNMIRTWLEESFKTLEL